MDTFESRRQALVVHTARAEDYLSVIYDRAADLLAEGETFQGLGVLFGVTRQSARERFGSFSGGRELATALRRVGSWHGVGRAPSRVRVSTVGRLVVFADGHGWRVLRHTASPVEAQGLATGLIAGGFRFVKTPADLVAADVEPWQLGPYATCCGCSTCKRATS